MSGKNQAVKVGLFVFIGLALIAVLMLNFSRGVGLFKPRYQLTMHTRSVAGLKEGADAFLSGVKIGSVKRIRLDHKNKGVIVHLSILDEFALHKDSRFMIEQQGVLGDQFVNIIPGSPDAPLLKDGDEVEGTEPFNLQEVAQSANGLIKRFDQLGASLGNVVDRINSQVLDAHTLSNLSQTIANFEQVSEHTLGLIDHTSGIVTNSGPVLALALTNMVSFSRKLEKLAMDLDETVNTNRLALNESMKNFQDATASMKQMTADIESGRGLVGGLLKDEQVRAQFSNTISNLAVLSSNLSHYGLLYKPKEPKPSVPSSYPGKSPNK